LTNLDLTAGSKLDQKYTNVASDPLEEEGRNAWAYRGILPGKLQAPSPASMCALQLGPGYA